MNKGKQNKGPYKGPKQESMTRRAVESLAGKGTTRVAKKLYEKAHYLYDKMPEFQTKGGMLGAYFNPRRPRTNPGPKEALGSDNTGLVKEPYLAASSGYLRQGNYFRTGGSPQAMTDLSGKGMSVDGIRYHFRESSPYRIRTDSTPHTSTVLTNDAGVTYVGGFGIGLTNVGPKVAIQGTMFGWYAYRELTVTYVPACPATTAGMLSLTLDSNTNLGALVSGLTQEEVLEHQVAGGTTVWNPMSLKIKFNGMKLWSTTSAIDAGEISAYYQFALYAALNTVIAGGQFGSLVFSGIVDFYKMSSIHTGNPVLDEEELWNRFCHKKWLQFILTTVDAERVTFAEFLKRYRDKIILAERLRFKATKTHLISVVYDPEKEDDEKKH